MGLLSSLQKIVATPLVGVGNLIIKGINVFKKDDIPTGTVEGALKDPVIRGLTNVILGAGAGLAAVAVAPAAASSVAAAGGTKAVIQKAATSLIPSTTKGKVIAAVAAPVVIGAVAKEPVKSFKAAVQAPSELAQFGGDIATFAANPSLESAKQIVKESPIISAAAGLLVAGGAIKTIAPAIATIKQTEAIKEQTTAIQGATASIGQPQGITVTDLSKVQTPLTPVMPQTSQVSSATPTRKRRKGVKKAVLPSINQSVRVNVINSSKSVGISQTKRYLNRQLLN